MEHGDALHLTRCISIPSIPRHGKFAKCWHYVPLTHTHTDWSCGFSADPQHPRAGRGEGFVLRYLRGMAEIKLNYSENLLGEILSLMWQIWLIALKVT